MGCPLYLDLEQGCRVAMPNLERIGQMRLDYRYLDEVAVDQEKRADKYELVADNTPEHRG